jgi:p-hydroxybenzoate 3-monooxygenase
MRTRTQVGIVGAGPAGLLLGHLLQREGIESIVIEDRSRDYVENRIRAGVLEQGSVDVLNQAGLGERMQRESLVHDGIELRFQGAGHRIDFPALTGGKRITVYGQHEVVKDLIAARLAVGASLVFEVTGASIAGFNTDGPIVRYAKDGFEHEIGCDFIAGCDGFHGVCRQSVPDDQFTVFERVYPYGWLGILAQSIPASHELVYVHHERGFALLSMRSPTLSRLYIQCDPEDDLANWPDERIWEELQRRTALAAGGFHVPEGPILQKGITPMRSYVVEPMQYGRLFLAGDAAHIVPPTGAKGMNLAVADVLNLTEALKAFYRDGATALLDGYSARCLRRVWRAQRFSWWMTTMLHCNPNDTPFDRRRQLAELDYVTSSNAAMRSLAENYVGLPFEPVAVN